MFENLKTGKLESDLTFFDHLDINEISMLGNFNPFIHNVQNIADELYDNKINILYIICFLNDFLHWLKQTY